MKETGNKFLWICKFRDRVEGRGIFRFFFYSLYDHRWVYDYKELRNIYEDWHDCLDLIFDETNNMIYMVTNFGLVRSKIFWQKQELTRSLSNFLQFNRFQDDFSFSQYEYDLGYLTSFPQLQNLCHMFAIRDMDEHLTEALENKSIRYISDRY